MKRKILIALLTLGTIGGFASGISSMRWRHHHRRAAFEQHVARVCVDAARGADLEARQAPAASPRAD